ncbi:cyclin-like protein [Suillus paluster]|uniref:cyclin-like protein n=1 Tax=Suillus paluster TaxID=48578 RepID=UPI001B8860F4|nr:cyclin-like protein [Suillus paluster]KAG1749025.1 cyclin-like protein [Suillus paluster]
MPADLVPLASPSQIERTPSREDGIPEDLEEDLRAFGCKLIHEAGILLKQKQVAVATAQILFQRFWYATSMKQFGIGVSLTTSMSCFNFGQEPIFITRTQDIGMGALYLASKLEECPLRMRDLINIYDLLLQRTTHTLSSSTPSSSPSLAKGKDTFKYAPMSYFGNTFYDLKDALVVAEMQILKRLGFNVHVVLPYGTLINYLRVLGLTSRKDACARAWGYLNDALQTPVYALYAVPTIVSAAILLTSRQLDISLPSSPPNCWWDLFDAPWEDVWSVCGCIMHLYRDRTGEDRMRVLRLVSKKDVRGWLEENVNAGVGVRT